MSDGVRVLFVGELSQWSRSSQRKVALEDIGCRVVALSSIPQSWLPHEKGPLFVRALARLKVPWDLTGANKGIISTVRRDRPDVVWVEKGNTVWPWTLRLAKKISPQTKLISYSEDDMFAAHNRSVFYTLGVRLYDLVATTKSYNCSPQELPSLGARRVVFVDKAYDPHTHRPFPLTDGERRRLGANVGFVGSFEPERARSMLHLAANGVRVRVWGADWKGCAVSHQNLIIENRPVYGDEYAKAVCATRINLCFLRKANRDLQTDRTMEIPACGGFMLAERTKEHLRLFEEGKEAAYFGSNEELLARVRYYLDHEEERAAIAAAGRGRCVRSGYRHQDRMRYLLSVALSESY